jgi:hypothetical protein
MKPIEQRFWAKVEKTEGCWLWKGATNKQGYGKLGKGKARDGFVAAHRLSYILAYGAIPDELEVLHQCDNSPCVRPDHLFFGTQTDNLADMTAKGHRRYRAHWGEDNGRARLTRAQVDKIKQDHAAGKLRSALAREYDVNWSTIDRIVRGKRWNP